MNRQFSHFSIAAVHWVGLDLVSYNLYYVMFAITVTTFSNLIVRFKYYLSFHSIYIYMNIYILHVSSVF